MTDEPFDLTRFTKAQAMVYESALAELKNGQKRTHWMWYIFPQIAGLGYSPNAKYYAIQSLEEARSYLDHPVLGTHLRECAQAILVIEGRTAYDIFGPPDDMKLKSSMTLFAYASEAESIFDKVLEKYFAGERDNATLKKLE